MTIYDIAKKANVSIATVSRVINNSGYVGEKNRKKINALIKENNYLPSSFAKNLSTNNSLKIIGIICFNIEDMYYAKSVSILEKQLKKYGYDIILSCTGESNEQKKKSVDILISKNIDALIFVGSIYAGKTENIIITAAKYVPIFIINAFIKGNNIYCAYCDDLLAVKTATQLLIKANKKNIIYFYDVENYGSTKKIEGFKLVTKGQVIKTTFIDCANVFVELLNNNKIDAILCANDMLAANLQKKINQMKISIPIIGHNNSPICDLITPELSSIDNKVGELSTFTAQNIKKLFDTGIAEKEYLIQFEIIRRKSF